MPIFSSSKATTKFTPNTLELPLKMMTYLLDPVTRKPTTVLNPALPDMLAKFAYAMDKAPDTFSNDVFKNWLSAYLVMSGSPSAPVLLGGTPPGYQLRADMQTTSNVLAQIGATLRGGGTGSQYAYVGLHLLTAWYFLVYSADIVDANKQYFNHTVKDFIAEKSLDWTWKGVLGAKVHVDPDYVHVSNVYTSDFLERLLVIRNSIESAANWAKLGDISKVFIASGVFAPVAKRRAAFAFMKFHRALFIDMLKAEYRSLLATLGDDIDKSVTVFNFYAVGNGSGSSGFFGTPATAGLGLTFFDYKARMNLLGPPFYKAVSKREDLIWEKGKSSAPVPSIFMVQWGAEWTGSTAQVIVDDVSDPNLLIVKGKLGGQNQASLEMKTSGAAGFTYTPTSGMLTFKPDTKTIKMEFTSHSKDEVSFFVFAFYPPSGATIIPLPPADPRLRIDTLYLDNEFTVPLAKALTFWTPAWPGVTPQEGAAQQAALNSLVLKMRDDPSCMIQASISGMGIGERVDMFGANEFYPDLVSAQNQMDNQIPNIQALGKQTLRYSYGDVIWTSGTAGAPGLLDFCTQGFASPLRCTWSSWAPFQIYVPALGSTKAVALLTDIGQHLRDSLNLGPSYNTALSAFRAFGMLEAMITRLKDCADDLTPSQGTPTASQLSAQQRDDIKNKLDDFLQNHAKCLLLQVGLGSETPVIIDYPLFHKYAD
jgi:hypothetical protein